MANLPKTFKLGLIELPEMLDIPEDLLPLIVEINGYRYFLVDSGRSAAKSQSVARILLWLGEQKKLRIVCGREFQNSIEESVYTIFKDLIDQFSLNYEVSKTEITHRLTGTSIKFRGFREQGSTNIKGLEGVDILWVDEAQAISKGTLEVIIPTIRKENAKVFWTMNRHVENDPVFEEFVNRPDCLHIHTDYTRNKHCPETMKNEAEICRKKSLADYAHIWLGKPLEKGSDFLFSLDLIRKSISLDLNRIGISRRVMANDVARFGNCENVFSVIESRGPVYWEQIVQECYRGMGLDETVGKHYAMKNALNLDLNVVDDDGMGGGVTDNIKGIDVIPFSAVKDYSHPLYDNRKTEGYFKLMDWMEKGWLKIMNEPVLHKQLLEIRYTYSKNGKKMIVPKTAPDPETGKQIVQYWDRADGLMMAVFYADQVMGSGFGLPAYALHDNPALARETANMSPYAKIS